MDKEKWVEILVVLIILGTLAWLAVTVFSLSATVGKVDGTLQETSRRLDRIVDVLPDMRIKIAQERISRNIDIALLCLTSRRPESARQRFEIRFLDLRSSKGFSFTRSAEGLTDKRILLARHILRGATGRGDDTDSLGELERLISDSGSRLKIPSNIDKDCSYVFSAADTEAYRVTLKSYENSLTLLDGFDRADISVTFAGKTISELLASIGGEE